MPGRVVQVSHAICGDLLPECLSTELRGSLNLAQTRHAMNGETHPRLASEDVANLVTPIPGTPVQAGIATEVHRRRAQARRLRAAAEAGWAAARHTFEDQPLGPAH